VIKLFYGVVLLVSLAGAGQGATGWLNWWAPLAYLAVGAVELGGVALSVHADRRRRLGERAAPARLMSAAVAAGAVAVNYFGHSGGPAYFFAGMSALGYSVWLIDSSAARRDALRAAGKLEGTAPAYGVWQWVRHPAHTARARHLALRSPALGKFGSLTAAGEQVRAERRAAAISSALRTRIAAHVDPTMATIAVNTYDLDTIAARLAAGADYAGLTALLADELMPTKLHTPTAVSTPARVQPVSTATAHDVAVSEAAMRGEHPDGSSLFAPVAHEQIEASTLTVPAVPPVGEQVDEVFSLAQLMPMSDGVQPVSAPPAPAHPLPQRKRVSTYDVPALLAFIDTDRTDAFIGNLPDMPSRATVQRVRAVYAALKADPLADVSGKGVGPDVVQIIRASVQR
jgi:hypothetical protein